MKSSALQKLLGRAVSDNELLKEASPMMSGKNSMRALSLIQRGITLSCRVTLRHRSLIRDSLSLDAMEESRISVSLLSAILTSDQFIVVR